MQIYTDQTRQTPVAEVWYYSFDDGPDTEGFYCAKWGEWDNVHGPFRTQSDAINAATGE